MEHKLQPTLNELEGTLLFAKKHLEEYSNEDLDKIEVALLQTKQSLRILKDDANRKKEVINSHPSIKRNKIEARDDASPNHDAINNKGDKE